MKKQLVVITVLLGLISYGCRESRQQEQSGEPFYPIGNFIRSQLLYIDSMPLAIIKYTTLDHTTDTSIMNKDDFKGVAGSFMDPDISSPELSTQYNETSFIDASLGTITLTYLANNKNAKITKADVLLNAENTQVKTIYIEKNIPAADSLVIRKMLWTANRNCQVTTIIQNKEGEEKIITEKYVWDL